MRILTDGKSIRRWHRQRWTSNTMLKQNSEYFSLKRHQSSLQFCLEVLAVLVFVALSANPVQAQDTDEGPQDGVLRIDRAWDYRPYRVRVWICTDGSPDIIANYDSLVKGIQRRSIVADPSAWEFLISQAPTPWRYRFLTSLHKVNEDADENVSGFEELPELKYDDKLMVVCLESKGGLIRCRVRELDLLTRQWGAVVKRDVAEKSQLDATVFDLISTAFMPIARVERVDRENNVYLRARAVKACKLLTRDEAGEWQVIDNVGSPVWVRDNDRFLPIIRKTDRSGEISQLKPIEFTFLSIADVDGAFVTAKIQSYHRAPLAGRTSKRAQKLALVIRPPEQSTELKFVSRDDETYALEGFEIYSRRVGAKKEEASEYLGITDWRGLISIPPSEHGLRIVYVKRGNRPLKKLPIMPGLYTRLQTTLPNDEARLNAEGIIKGLESEILNLVAQRALYEKRIDNALEKDNLRLADELFNLYNELPTSDDMNLRISNDEQSLRSQTSDKRERELILKMFSTLRTMVSTSVANSKIAELNRKIRIATESAEGNQN